MESTERGTSRGQKRIERGSVRWEMVEERRRERSFATKLSQINAHLVRNSCMYVLDFWLPFPFKLLQNLYRGHAFSSISLSLLCVLLKSLMLPMTKDSAIIITNICCANTQKIIKGVKINLASIFKKTNGSGYNNSNKEE